MAGGKTSKRITVSDHALFRWIDRAGVVDVEQLRASLAAALDRAYQASAAMGGGDFLILQGGLVYVVRAGVVVTVTEEDNRHRRARSISGMPKVTD